MTRSPFTNGPARSSETTHSSDTGDIYLVGYFDIYERVRKRQIEIERDGEIEREKDRDRERQREIETERETGRKRLKVRD